MKNKLKEKRCASVAMMKEELKWIKCQDITRDMCKTLALSMPRKLMAVLETNNGHAMYLGAEGGLLIKAEFVKL